MKNFGFIFVWICFHPIMYPKNVIFIKSSFAIIGTSAHKSNYKIYWTIQLIGSWWCKWTSFKVHQLKKILNLHLVCKLSWDETSGHWMYINTNDHDKKSKYFFHLLFCTCKKFTNKKFISFKNFLNLSI